MYRLSDTTLDVLSSEIADVLEKVPAEDRDSIISKSLDKAQKLRARRFANQLEVNEYVAAKGITDPYNFVRKLLTEGRNLLTQGNMRDLLLDWLFEHNHGHSGWVESVHWIYCTPQSEKEQQIANDLWQLVHDALEKMLEAPLPAESISDIMNLRTARGLLNRLGRNAPEALRQKLEDQEARVKKSRA